MRLLLLLALQGPPAGETLDAALDDILRWPDAERVEVVVPELDPQGFLGVRHLTWPMPIPKQHGPEIVAPAVRDIRRRLEAVLPGVWEAQEPASVGDRFTLSLRKGEDHATADLQIREGAPVLLRVEACVSTFNDWSRFGSGTYATLFGMALRDPQIRLDEDPHGAAAEQPIAWAAVPYPRSPTPSMSLRGIQADRVRLEWIRGLSPEEAAAEGRRLDGVRWAVTPRRAAAIAARTWTTAFPKRMNGARISGAGFLLMGAEAFPGDFIGGINRTGFYRDEPSFERFRRGEAVIGAWFLTVSGPGWHDRFRIWIAADTGRPVYIWGPQ